MLTVDKPMLNNDARNSIIHAVAYDGIVIRRASVCIGTSVCTHLNHKASVFVSEPYQLVKNRTRQILA